MKAIYLVFVDGQFAESLSNHRDLPATVEFSHENKVQLRFSKNSKCTAPLYLKFINQGNDFLFHMDIIAESQSEAILVEEYADESQIKYISKKTIQLDLHPDSHIQYYKLQNANQNATQQSEIGVDQKRASKIELFFADCGSKSASETVQINLQEPSATCHLKGFYFLQHDQQTLDYKINVAHTSEYGVSTMYFKGILDNKSRALFHGKVHIEQAAGHSKTEQANHNLLLSNTAEVKTEPHLEIYADEVNCRHGATVGQLDPEALFYLRSRGIPEASALNLLTQAFAADVIDQINDVHIRKLFQERVMPYADY